MKRTDKIYLPKFKRGDPQDEHERLICEFIDVHTAIFKVFVNNKAEEMDDHDLFLVLRDGVIGFAGRQIEYLTTLLASKGQLKHFLDEAHEIFGHYLHCIEKEYKNERRSH